MLCQFQVYRKVNQLYMHTPFLDFLPIWVTTEHRGEFSVLQQFSAVICQCQPPEFILLKKGKRKTLFQQQNATPVPVCDQTPKWKWCKQETSFNSFFLSLVALSSSPVASGLVRDIVSASAIRSRRHKRSRAGLVLHRSHPTLVFMPLRLSQTRLSVAWCGTVAAVT